MKTTLNESAGDEITFEQVAASVLNGPRWEPYRHRLRPDDIPMLQKILADSLRDLNCVLKWGLTFSELINTDEGMIRLATVFRDCVFNPTIQARYRKAQAERDNAFLVPFMTAMRQPAERIHRTTMNTWHDGGADHFLFLNWYLPLINPSLDQGLIVRTIPEIRELAEREGGNKRRWSDDDLKKDLKRLGLLPRPDPVKNLAGSARLSDFLAPA